MASQEASNVSPSSPPSGSATASQAPPSAKFTWTWWDEVIAPKAGVGGGSKPWRCRRCAYERNASVQKVRAHFLHLKGHAVQFCPKTASAEERQKLINLEKTLEDMKEAKKSRNKRHTVDPKDMAAASLIRTSSSPSASFCASTGTATTADHRPPHPPIKPSSSSFPYPRPSKRQATLGESWKPALKEVDVAVARFFYHDHIAFNAARPYVGDMPKDMPAEDQPEVEELDEILVSEQILAHKERKVKDKVVRRYLVKFSNYPPMDPKWMEEGELAESPTVMDGYKEEGSSSQDRQSNPTVHEVGEGSSQAEEGFSHVAFSITGTASPGTLFGGMQSMVPNPMYANIGLHPGFQGTQGQFGVSQGNLGMAGFYIPPVNMAPTHQHVTGQGVQMAPTVSITGTASPGTLFGGMQSMVPNPMYANIGLHLGFQGTQGQFGVSQGNLGMAGFSIPPVNMAPRHQHVTGQGVQMAPTGVSIMHTISFDNLESMEKPKSYDSQCGARIIGDSAQLIAGNFGQIVLFFFSFTGGALWKIHHLNERRKTEEFYSMLEKNAISVVVEES
ncbi:hypothetical protein L7F22_041452 [Adiantum nelumboides]|nr:hypothetical protein [Adiantum nelumboides]